MRAGAVRVMRIARGAVLCLLLGLSFVAAASAASERPPYSVKIKGAPEGVEKTLEQVSQLVAMQDDPPRTLSGLRRRAEGDRERLLQVMHAEAYFEAVIDFDLRTDDQGGRVVKVAVRPGPRYPLTEFEVRYKGLTSPRGFIPPIRLPEGFADFQLTKGQPARGADVNKAQNAAIAFLKARGFPFARVTDRKVFRDPEAQTITVSIEIDAGGYAEFGEVTINGLDRVKEIYLRELIPWKKAEPFDTGKIARYADLIEGTGLFADVKVRSADAADAGGRVPVTVTVSERKRRAVGAGVSFATNEGVGARAYWEHRNFFGKGETLRFDGTAAQIRQRLAATYREPRFYRIDQSLVSSLSAGRERSDAFDQDEIRFDLAVERQLNPRLILSVGGALSYTRTTDNDTDLTAYLASLPLRARWDSTEDLLDPSTGARLDLTLEPHVGTSEGGVFYTRLEALASHYWTLDGEGRHVAALRGRLGSVVGAERSELPASDRFYAGGGGSVRGFGYQQLGPLDDDNDPAGGRAVWEIGAEYRYKITKSIGIVPFVEAGAVYQDQTISFEDDVLFGAGLGVRYYTALGPIRFDIATPLNPREEVDDPIQIYISLGQAF